MWGQKVTEDFSHQKLKPKTESCQTLKGKGLFVCNLLGLGTFSVSKETVSGTSGGLCFRFSRGVAWQVAGGDLLQ